MISKKALLDKAEKRFHNSQDEDNFLWSVWGE